jgi:hypothetical protein
MRLKPIAFTAFVACLLSLIAAPLLHAQTGIAGVFDIMLKANESAGAPDGEKVTLYRKSKALVIGMNTYDGHAWPQLSNGVRDAEEVAKGLEAQGFEVTLKKDLKSDDLDALLKSFFIVGGDDPNSRLLLWFAGHGDTIDGEAYIVPVDAPSSKDSAAFRAKAISLRRFGEYMREARARHVLAIFDSCFSGSVFNVARSLPPPAITLATTQPVREFISSGEAEQQVSDDGTFRKLFLDVLSGREPRADANGDGYVTGTELGLFLQTKITNLTNNRQTPRYGKLNSLGYDRGDFVFQVGKPQAPPSPLPSFPPISEAAQAWAVTQGTTSVAVLEEFIRQFDNTPYGPMARARLEELKKSQLALASPPPEAKSRPEAKPVAVPPPAGPDEVAWGFVKDSQNSEQLRRFLEQFPNSTHRVDAIERLASLEQASSGDLAKKLQIELRRVGCLSADANGDWNADSRRALEAFNKHSGASLDTKLASIGALDAVRTKTSRICPLVCARGQHVEDGQCVATVCRSGYTLGEDGSCERRRYHYGAPAGDPQSRSGKYHYGPWVRERRRDEPAARSGGPQALPPGVQLGCPPAVMPCITDRIQPVR